MANKKLDTLMQMAGKNQQKRESEIREAEVSATTNNEKGGGETTPAEEEKITPEKKKQTSTAKKETRGRKPRAGVPDAERPSAERGFFILNGAVAEDSLLRRLFLKQL